MHSSPFAKSLIYYFRDTVYVIGEHTNTTNNAYRNFIGYSINEDPVYLKIGIIPNGWSAINAAIETTMKTTSQECTP
jgi:hypothetical protein